MAKATTALKALEKVWSSKNIEIETKKKVLQTCVFSTLLVYYTDVRPGWCARQSNKE